ncbi:hypothetical protein, partial [Paraburkholderia sp. RL18-085-BIA-A]|uniref:hypothetical protein n=1 Tax=Paraburkholderia sp. RL18-085-BIA-A TaxID=3031633 RepID=UPI0038BAF6C1
MTGTIAVLSVNIAESGDHLTSSVKHRPATIAGTLSLLRAHSRVVRSAAFNWPSPSGDGLSKSAAAG